MERGRSDLKAAFELMDAGALSGTALRKVADFLDTQDTTHPFQFPQWLGLNAPGSPAGVCFALFWEGEQLRWFARCGTRYPAGSMVSGLRALTVTRGPVCDDINAWRDALHAFAEHGKLAGFAYAEIAPERVVSEIQPAEILSEEGWNPGPEGRVSLRLDIRRDEDRLIGAFRKTTRHEVQRAERVGLAVETAHNDQTIFHFLKMHDAMGERKGFAAEAPGHLRNVIRWLSAEPERGAFLSAHLDGHLLGGVVIVRAGKRCWYVWGATTRQEGFSVGHLLQWEAIKWAKASGCTEYDFGGYREGATSGPALFKQGFGGKVVRFVPSHRRILSPSKYRMLQLVSKLRRSSIGLIQG